jgi:retron-type reverse transcriptase
MTPGVVPETLDGFSQETLDLLVKELKKESFKFKPARRVYIPKPNGKLRPLSIGSPRDKIVQEAIRMILEAIYEPIFRNESHGFRPNRSCHTALKCIYTKFQQSI